MGNPTLYYYPPGSSEMELIELPYLTGGLDPQEELLSYGVEPYGGSPSVAVFGHRRRLTINAEFLTNTTLLRDLAALIGSLRRGGWCGFCFDSAKAVGWYTTDEALFGDSVLRVNKAGGSFEAYLDGGALSSGDELLVSDLLTGVATIQTYSAISGKSLTLGDTMRAQIPSGAFVRYKHFYPMLTLSEEGRSGAPLSAQALPGTRVWSLELDLIEHPYPLALLSEDAEDLASSEYAIEAGGLTHYDVVSPGPGAIRQPGIYLVRENIAPTRWRRF